MRDIERNSVRQWNGSVRTHVQIRIRPKTFLFAPNRFEMRTIAREFWNQINREKKNKQLTLWMANILNICWYKATQKGSSVRNEWKKKSVIVAIKMASNVKIPLNCKACWPCSRPLHYLIVCCCFASCLFLILSLSFSLYVWCVWIGCFFGAAITHYHSTRMRQLH